MRMMNRLSTLTKANRFLSPISLRIFNSSLLRSPNRLGHPNPARTSRLLFSTQREEESKITREELSSPAARKLVTEHDEKNEESVHRRLSDVKISEVLKAKHSYRWVDPVIDRDSTVRQAISTVIEGGLSGMMVLEPEKKHVVGLLTSRDLLRIMAAGIKDGESSQEILDRRVGEHMTPLSQVVYAKPDETVGMCRAIMLKLGIKCLPVLSKQGRVEGLLTARDMSDFGLTAKDKGGKKNYLQDVSDRVGLKSDTSMAEPPTYLRAHLALEQNPLFVNIGAAALPHPFKGQEDRGRSIIEYTNDLEHSEDSSFHTVIQLPDEKDKNLRDFHYFGVADGVGSWREYGVDPKLFSRNLMQECYNILHEASRTGRVDGIKFRQVIPPATLMAQAYERVKTQNIIGSSTACVALFDGIRHQLHFSNLGDSGLIVLRHIDSDVAGSLKRDRMKPRLERTSDLRVAFVSQQQLRSFNHPFQLGWTGENKGQEESSSFKKPQESCTSSIHLRRGDIVIMATDGLFDNVELDDICAIALEWEQKHGFIRQGDIAGRERRWSMGNSLSGLSSEFISELAKTLCEKARANSLDSSIDSPFAILAKEK